MEKVAIYLRKSRGDIEDLEKHKMQLLEICQKKKYEYDLYEEVCSGDLLEERHKMNELLDNISKYTRILVVALDRLSRNELHQALITQILMENNILVETPSKIYDFKEEQDILMSDFEKLLARSELRITKKRLRLGKLNGARQGKFVHGSPSFPYVYNKITRELDVDEEQAKIYQFIIDRALEGITCNNIAFELNRLGILTPKRKNQWSSKTVRYTILDRTHLGEVKFEGKWYKGNHKPLKTLEVHNELVQILKGNKMIKTKKLVKHEYILTDIVKCKNCGMSMSYMDRKLASGKIATYIRNCWYKDSLGNKCNNQSINSSLVIDEINHHIDTEIFRLNELIQTNTKDLKALDSLETALNLKLKSIASLSSRKDRILEMAEGGLYTIAEAKEKINKLQEEEDVLRIDIEKLQIEINSYNNDTLEAKVDKIKSIRDIISRTDSKAEINKLYKTIIKRVEYLRTGDNVDITVEFL